MSISSLEVHHREIQQQVRQHKGDHDLLSINGIFCGPQGRPL